MRYILIIAALLLSPLSHAQYRCIENGKTVVTNRPCAGEAAPASPRTTNVIGDSGNSAYATSSGAWRGQVQFMAKQGTAIVSEAHAVVPTVIEVDPGGKVSGISTETGCSFKGIAKPGIVETITDLDVTLSGCKHAGYNRQMTGRLARNATQKYVDFSLTAFDVNQRPPGFWEIKGTLRR